ncbi:MAG: hypothetical protein U5O39_05925 [Gammaproteobacteria bacterium]|nr:hypothetical protein [Gammaproteobacteria bacterium]
MDRTPVGCIESTIVYIKDPATSRTQENMPTLPDFEGNELERIHRGAPGRAGLEQFISA